MSRNIKLTLSWNGAKFNGYQSQPHGSTVQDTLNQAWRVLTGESVVLFGCSRLDAKVHANHYVLNFQSESNLSSERILRSLNGILHNQFKADICIYDCEFVDSQFHARFHTAGKHYRYLIWRGFKTHALFTPQCWHVHSKHEITNLEEILQEFVGEHDFAGFRACDCSAKNTIKHIYAIRAQKHPQFPEMIIVDFWGDGFLKNMIRNMIGTAVDISIGKIAEDCIQKAFIHKNRRQVGVCAPPWALTLMRVYYNKDVFILDSQALTRAL